MPVQYHILNGDALKNQFPKAITGKLIIARECLIEGPTQETDFDDFFASRATFICKTHTETEENYIKNVKSEFQKILNITQDCEINLWFEQDLFCQVNLWFVTSLIAKNPHLNKVFLVMPNEHSPYTFGKLGEAELIKAYKDRKPINKLENFAELWRHYQNNDLENLRLLAEKLQNKFPFLLPAIEAHIARIPKKNNPGRPINTILEIMTDLKTEDFSSIFREFCKRESIYGFGDLQVKKLLEKAKKLQ
ncbi:DUF1835 domain-containing protein [Zunongwangia sp. HGR-M22]|uniref:DUF1835 domain-containing protein n=1 Tax=Zunongwangia sp. HGR-M22 TaxID=3015168 RepID=UPI0022DE194A|nr:DUF1835 domain-containing protein [Zunongwangia sp. HGR-M22]WBL26503.1 DUF1835 domain-containing protein [Zunongwangia sp. HGR-M22]